MHRNIRSSVSGPLVHGPLSRRAWLRMGLAGFASGLLPVPSTAEARLVRADPKNVGMIYTTANLIDGAEPNPVSSLIAIDPETGEWKKVLDGCDFRPRASRDGKMIAFAKDGGLWTRAIAGGEAKRILDMEGATSGSPPVWSGDGKEIIVSLGRHDNTKQHWVFKTLRVAADGSKREELKIPAEDGVQDWSADGEWVVTTSSRNAKIGWQLYMMHTDGTGQRQVTEGGNPFYVRFSPDGKRLLYSDGTSEERRGVWVVDVDGTNRRRIFPTGSLVASACWSPDGTRIAIGIRDLEGELAGRTSSRIEVMDLEGEHRLSLTLPDRCNPDMPDWR